MRHLDIKSCSTCHGQTGKKPGSGGHQAYGCRRSRTQTSYHGCIYELHEDGGNLRDDGRDTELHGQPELLAESHRLTVLHHLQQVILPG